MWMNFHLSEALQGTFFTHVFLTLKIHHQHLSSLWMICLPVVLTVWFVFIYFFTVRVIALDYLWATTLIWFKPLSSTQSESAWDEKKNHALVFLFLLFWVLKAGGRFPHNVFPLDMDNTVDLICSPRQIVKCCNFFFIHDLIYSAAGCKSKPPKVNDKQVPSPK